jgi:hypothetical protein
MVLVSRRKGEEGRREGRKDGWEVELVAKQVVLESRALVVLVGWVVGLAFIVGG